MRLRGLDCVPLKSPKVWYLMMWVDAKAWRICEEGGQSSVNQGGTRRNSEYPVQKPGASVVWTTASLKVKLGYQQ